MVCSEKLLSAVSEIDKLMQCFSHHKKDLGYGYRWTFENGHRFDLLDYRKQGIPIFRVGRGARLARKYPVLQGWFDEVLRVIAKLELSRVELIQEKHIGGVLKLIEEAPSGIGAFD